MRYVKYCVITALTFTLFFAHQIAKAGEVWYEFQGSDFKLILTTVPVRSLHKECVKGSYDGMVVVDKHKDKYGRPEVTYRCWRLINDSVVHIYWDEELGYYTPHGIFAFTRMER